ncbi:efflux RND transporter periplasmic adaptor subunit [Compostibacter hankyongensis]|uniref:Efflux RND transporter periplasmic adaptor subunit n=1 Tax=Compostibacter hankyongensis TaxID=1007089 RepID=A0ABP8FTS1_9BACT
MSNKTIRLLILIIVIGLVGLLIYNKVKKDQHKNTAGKMLKKSQLLPVDVYVVKPEHLPNSIDAPGSLLGNEAIKIQSETSGRITDISFKEGTHVAKGDLMVKLFDADLQAQLEKLELQKALAEKTLSRQQSLLAINGISQQEVDNTRNQVAGIQADIDYNKALVRKTEIRAPFSGIVGLRYLSEGAIVSPSDVIADFQQTDPIKLDFSLPEKYRSQLKTGDPITFTIAAYSGKVFKGNIYAIDPAIDVTTRTVRVRARCANSSGALTPGSYANVHISFKEIPDALMIPTQALVPTTRESQVVLIKGGKARFVTVYTGLRTADKIQITRGVAAGDTVVTAGTMQAKEGLPVEIINVENK